MLPYDSLEGAELALGRNLTVAERLWFSYSAHKSDYILHIHNCLFLFLVFSLVPLPWALVELYWFDAVDRFKLQPRVKRSFRELFKCYKDVLHQFIFVVVPLIIVSFPALEWVGIRTSLPLPTKWEVISQLIVYFLVEDYTNYWIHRFLHSEWGYKKIHYMHHEYNAPIGFAAPYAHWAEILILGIPTFLGPAMVPCHITTLWLWSSLRQVEAIETHSGENFPFNQGGQGFALPVIVWIAQIPYNRYNFPWSPTKLIPFYGGPEYHDFHHFVGGQCQSNFASIFTYCDYLYGTNKGYRRHKQAVKKA